MDDVKQELTALSVTELRRTLVDAVLKQKGEEVLEAHGIGQAAHITGWNKSDELLNELCRRASQYEALVKALETPRLTLRDFDDDVIEVSKIESAVFHRVSSTAFLCPRAEDEPVADFLLRAFSEFTKEEQDK